MVENKTIIADGQGERKNTGKLRYDLVHPEAHEGMVKVLTKGAEKYAERNWERGMKWSICIASAKRHLAAIERGEDYDIETGLLHADHLQCNAHFLSAYNTIFPQGDDRIKWWKKPLKKVWLDIDGVLADYEKHFLSYFNLPSHSPTDWDDARFRDNFSKTFDNEDFWLTCSTLIKPEQLSYPIAGYCTTRPIKDEIVREWLNKCGYPAAELINIYHDKTLTKAKVLKEKGCDVFVDDSIKNFMDINQAGVQCYLMTRPHNTKYDVGHMRVDNMDDFVKKLKT